MSRSINIDARIRTTSESFVYGDSEVNEEGGKEEREREGGKKSEGEKSG